MEAQPNEPVLVAVAGCLFEVSMPEREDVSWALAEPQVEATLVAESVRDDRRHFRFRAEAEAAVAGQVALRFRRETVERGTTIRVVVVPVAPEHDA